MILQLNGNNLTELPLSFASLKQSSKFMFEMNSLESPPMKLFNEGIQSVFKYCLIRSHRLNEMVANLKAVGANIPLKFNVYGIIFKEMG